MASPGGVDKAKEVAMTGGNMIRPITVGGKTVPAKDIKIDYSIMGTASASISFPTGTMLRTGDHVNVDYDGKVEFAGIVGQYLVHRPDLPRSAWQDLATELVVGRDVAFASDFLLPFARDYIKAVRAAAEAELQDDEPSLFDLFPQGPKFHPGKGNG